MDTAFLERTDATNIGGRRCVVITGIGAVTPLGLTALESWQGLLAGRSGIGPITRFDASALPVHIAGEVRDFQPELFMERKEVRRTSRASHLVVAAVRMALADAGLPEPIPNSERVGTVVGTGAGGLEVVERELTALRTRGFERVSPFALTGFLPNMPAYHVSLVTGAHGSINTVVAACASGSQAIADGAELIRNGRADLVVAAGVEGIIDVTSIGAFARINALSTRNDDPARACRPFDRTRDGTVLSEGVRGADSGKPGTRTAAKCCHLRRGGRLCLCVGCLPRHGAGPGGGQHGAVDALGVGGCWDCTAAGRLYQCPCYGDAAQ